MCAATGMLGQKTLHARNVERGQPGVTLLCWVPGSRSGRPWFLGALWLQWGLEGILSQVGRISSSPASREPFSVFYFLTFFVVAAAEARRKRGT